ncbi:MAG: DUF4126 domain-containing protein [Gemmatimonadetes bacterium]|nr:DUF4126 domain-containing protein [Gemmatimonadota bacterium]
MTQSLLPILLGLALAAACGFRVFAPLLIAGAAAHTGHLTLASDFAWLGTTPALIALGTAAVLEIGAYFVPWLDHALDLLATPTAVVAGILAAVAVMVDLPPPLRWGIGVIGGGTVAGVVQGSTVLLRAKSTALTGGLGNPVVAAGETAGAIGIALLAILVPVVVVAAVVVVVGWRMFRRG